MWIIFGFGAIISLGLNLVCYVSNKRTDIFRFISISLTALTVCGFYSQSKEWVVKEDWGAMMDVVPTTSTLLWVLVLISILINSISFVKKKVKESD